MKSIKNRCRIGADYIGGPTTRVIASQCPEITVNLVDINPERIALWIHDDLDQLPSNEPGLAELVGQQRCKIQLRS